MPENKMRPCPRCERERQAAEMTPERIAQIVAELPGDASTLVNATKYEARIKICSGCDALREGVLCSWCGCYVALRARPQKSYCPYPGNNKWGNL
ncbi:MAG: DUF6171 family protein [Treponemataceae bacterium]|nr:DUF6171 family protein [Treponemataceae bacterium]